MICDDNFHISHSDTYYGVVFINVLHPFKKFCKFYEYKKHKDGISKHYNFDISWENITPTKSELVSKIKENDDKDSKFKDIEYLFEKYFINNHIFIVPTENYSFVEYNTKTQRIEKHIINNNIINVNCSIDDTCYTDMKISYNNYKIIKEFEDTKMPIYKYCLTENIGLFNFIYCEYGDYDTDNSKIYALSDNYIYYIYINK